MAEPIAHPARTRDPRISDIFYYFEHCTDIGSGRTLGRKIGVVQEILCKKLLLQSEPVRDSLVYEPKVSGRSGATHKVEFVLFQPAEVLIVPRGSSLDATTYENLSVEFVGVNGEGKARIRIRVGTDWFTQTLKADQLVGAGQLRAALLALGIGIRLVSCDAQSARFAILPGTTPVATVESKRVGAQRFSGSDSLGSGIQTIEKAKQAALVGADFDLRFNETLLALSGIDADRPFRSFVVLGNGVHWTAHDLAVLETYVDYTYLVPDRTIIRYADYVKEAAEELNAEFCSFFRAYFQGMTKTPADAFAVAEDDFDLLRPEEGPSLLQALEGQVGAYPITAG